MSRNKERFTYLTGVVAKRIADSKGIEARYTWGSKISPKVQANIASALESAVLGGGEQLMLPDDDGRVYAYTGVRWEQFDYDSVVELCKRVLVACRVGAMYQQCSPWIVGRGLYSSVRFSDSCYEPVKRYVGFTNGVLDLKDYKFKALSPRYKPCISLDFPYDAHAPGLLWDIKVKEIIPDKGFREAFQQFCGALLVDRSEVKVEYLCYLYGNGANGKSVLANAVAGVLGTGYSTSFTPRELFQEGSSSMFNRAALLGKVLNYVDDLDDKDFSGGAMKKFISGDPIIAREPYGKRSFQIAQPPLMLCCANRIPETSDDSFGHHRRQLVVRTTFERFGETRPKDPMLGAKLATEQMRQRIFNWILDGYRMLMNNGGDLKLTEEVKRLQTELRDASSSMRRWMFDAGVVAGDDERGEWVPVREIYARYREYCQGFGYTPVRPVRDVARMLADMGVEKRRMKEGYQYYVMFGKD